MKNIIRSMHRAAVLFLKIGLAISVFVMPLFNNAPRLAWAQTMPQQEALTVKPTPSLPGEYQQVTLEAQSFSFDLDRSTITWFLNGKLIDEGVGKKKTTFETGALGSVNKVSVTAKSADKGIFSQSLSITPAEVDLVYESGTYTHPFYRGKALLPAAIPVRVIAIPNMKSPAGTRMDPSNLIYTWRDGNKVLGNLSGTGKTSITIDGPQIFRTKDISVEVSTFDNALHARRSISIAGTSGQVHIYEAHPLLGVLFNTAYSGTIETADDEFSLLSVPYFFKTSSRTDPQLAYSWKVNGRKVDNPGQDPGILVLRPDGSGAARIDSEVSRGGTVFERSVGSQNISFKKSPDSSL